MSDKVLVVEEGNGLALVRKSIQEIDGYQAPTDEQTQEAVDLWMDAHSASYVVPDNGITTQKIHDEAVSYEKLSSALQDQIENMINPDNYDGENDYEKLQAAIDYAIINDYGTVLINREYNITGHTLDVAKGLYQGSETRRRRLAFVGMGKCSIYKGDAGYIFTASSFSGDYAFINMRFEGSGGNNTRCSVFDCHKMIRINTYNCSYCNLGWVFDGSESNSFSSNMQSIKNYGDLCVYCTGYYLISYLWDCSSFGCIVESCSYGYLLDTQRTGTITSLHIIGCTLEDLQHEAIRLDEIDTTIRNLVVEDCYFEKNGDCDIYINSVNIHAISICKNKFTPNSGTYHCVDVLLVNERDYRIDENLAHSTVVGSYLVYVRIPNNAATTDRLKVQGVNYVLGGVTATNNDDTDYNPYATYSFYRENLSDADVITLPYKTEHKSMVHFIPIYNAAVNVTTFFPATKLIKGATSFTFYAKYRDGSTSTRTDIMGMFIVVPFYD